MPDAGPRARWSWIFFDWAAQPWFTLVLTFIIGPYFAASVAADPASGQAMWGWATAAGGLAVALLAPVLGAAADASGPRKPWIAAFSLLYVAAALMMWFAVPGGPVWPALLALAVGLIAAEFATVFTNAMMPTLAPPDRLGRLSGAGWAMGYAGGTLALLLTLAFLAENESGRTLLGLAPAFGLDPEMREGTRATGPLTAVWYAVFVAPLFLFVPDAPRRAATTGAVRRALRQLRAAIVDLRRQPPLARFLVASMVYRDALGGFYAFGGIYAAGMLGWSVVDVGVFGILAAAVGALGAWLGGRADDAVGPRRVVVVGLALLTAASLLGVSASREAILFVIPVGPDSAAPDLTFYAAGALFGAAGGAVQAASRTLLVGLAEPARMTSTFGLYALAGKATAFAAPALVGLATAWTGDQQAGILPVIALLALGWLLMLRQSEGARFREAP